MSIWFCSEDKELNLDAIRPLSKGSIKPNGGLWCSPSVGDHETEEDKKLICDWNLWCYYEEFRTNNLFYKINLKKNARVLKVTTEEKLKEVHKKYARKVNEFIDGLRIDFEKVAEDYDVFYIEPKQILYSNYGINHEFMEFISWDVKTYFIMNPECIESTELIK